MTRLLATICLAALLTPAALASDVDVTSNISASTLWTADNTYCLQGEIYVLPGATLTIEAGTVISSTSSGSLAVARGAQIFALGERGAPIVFTSPADVATWTSGDPRTGSWRPSAAEWGGLVLMGAAHVSEDEIPTNTAVPSPGNYANMAGLAPPPGSTLARYGAGDDDDDCGVLRYVSLRYGGGVLGLGNELNGLSLGGVGRGTDIHHVEVMNNLDDGIEVWGGTVNLKYFSIWNVGDDSLDIDQGWRGKAQFGLIVQGYSLDAPQGSGVGDNAIELDGAEASSWQPVTTAALYNLTVIGQPLSGDGHLAWRDGARAQFRSSIFMDGGGSLVRLDPGSSPGTGYGDPGAVPPVPGLTWAEVWTTPHSALPIPNAPAGQAAFYRAQVDGQLAEITGSVFYRNLASNAYSEAAARGVLDAANDNELVASPIANPLMAVTRSNPVLVGGGLQQWPLVHLDPRPVGAALRPGRRTPIDGFFSVAPYRGAFRPDTTNTWLAGWTASEAFGFTPSTSVGVNFCEAATNSAGVASEMRASGSALVSAGSLELEVIDVPPNEFGIFLVSDSGGLVPGFGGTSNGDLCLGGTPGLFNGPGQVQSSGPSGRMTLAVPLQSIPHGGAQTAVQPGDTWYFQAWHRDRVGLGSNLSNAVFLTFE